MLSISGGSGIVFADRAVQAGLTLPKFSDATLAALRKVIPAFGSVDNPADVTAGVFNDMSLFTTTLDIVLADPGIDQLSILLASIGGAPAQRAAEAIAAAAAKTDKPVHVAWSGRRARSVAAYEILEAARIPVLTTPVRLAQAAAVLARFADDRRRLLPRKAPPVAMPAGLVLPDGAVTLNEAESKAVLRAFGIPVAREALVADAQSAASALPDLDGPVRREDRLARHRPQDGSRRRQAVRGARRPRRGSPHRHRQREARPPPTPRSTACSSRKWRRAWKF